MTASPISDRSEARLAFLSCALPGQRLQLRPASSDASFRSYWRVDLGDRSQILMDAPPGQEDCRPWLGVAQRLRAAGVRAPEVYAADLELGFLLIEDLGDALLLPALNAASVDQHYGAALSTLAQMQLSVDPSGLARYDENRLLTELELFPTWFLGRHLGQDPDCRHWDEIELAFRLLLDSAGAQPMAFVHRDYHSRNLLLIPDGRLGVIDFQDAVIGPVSYDLVSLLRDCYIAWPRERVWDWAEAHRRHLAAEGLAVGDAMSFRRSFDWMGLQRHLKVLGIFARLWYRDGKAAYLKDLPLTLNYVLDTCDQYPEFTALAKMLRRLTEGRDLTCPRPA